MRKFISYILSVILITTLIATSGIHTEAAPNVSVSYSTHVQTYGWRNWVSNGEVSGTTGESKRLEGIAINVSGNSNLGIQYSTHIQTYGWLGWSSNGEISGTTGESKRLEAIKIQLTGADKNYYDVYYRVHAQTYGWLGWAKNGEAAGTAGYSKRLEGIQIIILYKGSSAPDNVYQGIYSNYSAAYITTGDDNVNVANSDILNTTYKTHVQTYGWQNWKTNVEVSGTVGESKRLEGIQIKISNKKYNGGIQYRTHVQTYGWLGWVENGAMSGTTGESKRLEAIEIKLTGDLEAHYDIYYRVHAQTYGWLGWAKNGEAAGTAGYSKRLEGIQIVIVEKGGAAPGLAYAGIASSEAAPYITTETSVNTVSSSMELKQLGNMQYYIYTLANPTANMPLIIYLHGGTNKASDVTTLLTTDGFPKYLHDGYYGDLRAYVVIPKLDNSYRGWSDVSSQIKDLISDVHSNYDIDINKVSLTGHSMGGTGTYQLQVKLPDTFACIAPMSGSIQNTGSNIAALSKTKIWAFVGMADTIVKPDSSIAIINSLSAVNANAKITKLDGATHFDVPSLAYKNQELIQWLVNCGE